MRYVTTNLEIRCNAATGLADRIAKQSATALVATKAVRMLTLSLLTIAVAGCAADNASKQTLADGYAALNNQDYVTAYSDADAFLSKTPAGPGTVEALYLKGRALELRKANSQAEAKQNLAEARACYVQALARQPKGKLEAYLHSSLANVAYFQDDYSSAINEWTKCYDQLDTDDSKAWALYRIGVARQRMGSFADADAAFTAVQQRFPNTTQATRAREHQGARAFFVQIGSYATPAAAGGASEEIKRQAIATQLKNDGKGHTIVLAGPIASYGQAASLKARLTPRFPDALIVP